MIYHSLPAAINSTVILHVYGLATKLNILSGTVIVVGIPMGTNCAPLVADSFLFCHDRDFKLSLSPDTQVNVIEAFNSTSRYLDDIFNIDNPFFDTMVNSIYPKELQLIKTNHSDYVASFLDLVLSISIENGVIIGKI